MADPYEGKEGKGDDQSLSTIYLEFVLQFRCLEPNSDPVLDFWMNLVDGRSECSQ